LIRTGWRVGAGSGAERRDRLVVAITFAGSGQVGHDGHGEIDGFIDA
jgi:hypothetical protein